MKRIFLILALILVLAGCVTHNHETVNVYLGWPPTEADLAKANSQLAEKIEISVTQKHEIESHPEVALKPQALGF